MTALGYGTLAIALILAGIDVAVKWGERRRVRWANETDEEGAA